MDTILVTGGAGFIGYHLSKRLITMIQSLRKIVSGILRNQDRTIVS